jgi:hypothetical protein
MPNPIKTSFLEQLTKKYGKAKQLPGSLSLFEIGDGVARIYIRYSKVHGKTRTFFGLRQDDLKQFKWDGAIIILFQ